MLGAVGGSLWLTVYYCSGVPDIFQKQAEKQLGADFMRNTAPWMT